MPRDKSFLPIPTEDEEHLLKHPEPDDHEPAGHHNLLVKQHANSRRLKLVSTGVHIVSIALIVILWAQYVRVSARLEARTRYDIYSPADSAVEYKNVIFTAGLGKSRSVYMGSSPEADKAWEDLYNEFGTSQIPTSSAIRLPNATSPSPNDPTNWIVQLDVFHQLHCLNLMRKLVYPTVYPEQQVEGGEPDALLHIEHCYESLRQSLMCHSDVATIYWEWVPERERMYGNLETTHTCKDFEKIRQWGIENTFKGSMDLYRHVEGAAIRHVVGDVDLGAGMPMHGSHGAHGGR